MSKKKLPEKWEREKKAVKAIQLAFDVEERIQMAIRREALELGVNPSDRIRQILGLPVNRRPQRPRLTISLSAEDFDLLADKFTLTADNRIGIKQEAADQLVNHVNQQSANKIKG